MSATRQPRAVVLANGTPATWERITVENNAYYSPDTFKLVVLPDTGLPASWWMAQSAIRIEVRAANDAGQGLSQLIIGDVDSVDYDVPHQAITVAGRDLTSAFIDVKIDVAQWMNHSAAELVRQLAAKAGLSAVVNGGGSQVGTIYTQDTVRLGLEKTAWDVLTWLASEAGNVVFVRGTTLYFQPPDVDPSPYKLQYAGPGTAGQSFTGMSLRLTRALTVARGVVVTVRSHSPLTGRVVSGSFPKSPKSISPGAAGRVSLQNYSFSYPNLTVQQCVAKAQALQKQITQHELRLSACLPGDNALTVDRQLQLGGTDTVFDQIFYPERIERRISMSEGYVMDLDAKNISAESTGTL